MTNDLNPLKSLKFAPEKIEEKSINNEEFEEKYDFDRLVKVKVDLERRDRSDRNRKK